MIFCLNLNKYKKFKIYSDLKKKMKFGIFLSKLNLNKYEKFEQIRNLFSLNKIKI
jgi:hypothetical protein